MPDIETRYLDCPGCGKPVTVVVEFNRETRPDFSATPHTREATKTLPWGILSWIISWTGMEPCPGTDQDGWFAVWMEWLEGVEDVYQDQRIHRTMEG